MRGKETLQSFGRIFDERKRKIAERHRQLSNNIHGPLPTVDPEADSRKLIKETHVKVRRVGQRQPFESMADILPHEFVEEEEKRSA